MIEGRGGTTLEARPTWLWPRAAYVHVPFCRHKCGYCDFASLAGADHLADRYLDAMERELELRLPGRQVVDTIFVGGGTPTRLSPEQLGRLTRLIAEWFELAPGGEYTVEANPGTLDAAKADVLADADVNRVSLGAQSFRRESLVALEREHDPEDVPRALELIRPRFERWSLDLIFGVPGSTLEDWQFDLERALELGPAHLSCYGLIFEKGTSLWKQWDAGQVRAVDEEVELAMFTHTIERLESAGLAQYEISNFAKAGHESRHNLVYWSNDAYFGIGLGAARYVDGERASNTREIQSYIRRLLEEGRDPTGPRERLEPEARARETAVLMLRRTQQGLDRDDFRVRTGYEIDGLGGVVIRKAVANGLLEDDGRRLRFTRDGLFLSDSVLSDLI